MSNDISKVYQFLSTIGDWKTNADKDGDGIIVKKEMRSFLQENYFENYSGWDGTAPTENQKNDIINQFWKSIDTNQVGKVGRYKNKNALDTTEQETTNTKVQCYEKLNDFVKENVKITDAPSGISSSQWKASITEGLTEALENFLKNKTADQISKALESGELDAILQKQLPLSKGRATADYYALNLAGQYKSELGNFDIYSDPVFKELLDKYIDSKFPDGVDPDTLPTTDEIKADIEKFVKAYLATANIGDGNIKDLEEEPFGYRQGNEDYLTALQKNQAKIKLNEQISSSYEAMFEEVFAGINLSASDKANLKSQLASTIETAKDTFINSLKYSDWANLDTKLQEFKLSDYVNTDMKNSILTSYYTEQAKAYISTYDVAAAMGKTLSTDVIASIKTALNGQVSGWVSTFVAAGSASGEFETYLNGKITEYLSSDAITESILMSNEEMNALLSGIKDSYSFEQNATDNKIQLPRSITCNGKSITTDKITYTGSGCVSINDSGLVTIDTSKPGTYSGTITVSIGNKTVTKTITVTVQESASSIVSKTTDKKLSLNENVDNWNEDANFQNLYNGDKTVIIGGWMDSGNKKSWGRIKDTLETKLTNLGSQVIDILATAGLDKTKLYTALQTVVRKYMDVDPIFNRNDKGDTKGAIINNCKNYMSDNRNNTKSRVVWTSDHDGADSHVYMIHFKDFVDDLVAEYNKLVA